MRANRWNADNSQKCCWFKKIMEENRKGQKNMVWFGRRQNLKTGKFGDTVLIMFAPYRIFQTFWISDIFEKCWSILDILEFENIFMAEDPPPLIWDIVPKFSWF